MFFLASALSGQAQAQAAAAMLTSLMSIVSYGFYLFCGVALCYAVLRFKRSGDVNELIRGLFGAAVLFTAPTFLSAVINLLG